MPTRTVTVGWPTGLHARPAAMFVAAAAAAGLPVTIRTATKPAVPTHSMLSVLSLGARCGTEVTLEAEGERAPQVLATLADLLAQNPGEEA